MRITFRSASWFICGVPTHGIIFAGEESSLKCQYSSATLLDNIKEYVRGRPRSDISNLNPTLTLLGWKRRQIKAVPPQSQNEFSKFV